MSMPLGLAMDSQVRIQVSAGVLLLRAPIHPVLVVLLWVWTVFVQPNYRIGYDIRHIVGVICANVRTPMTIHQ